MNIEINKFGIIQEGESKGWNVYIEDNRQQTGGYLILVTPCSKSIPIELGGYDNWVEDFDALQRYFEEAHWKVKWQTENNTL